MQDSGTRGSFWETDETEKSQALQTPGKVITTFHPWQLSLFNLYITYLSFGRASAKSITMWQFPLSFRLQQQNSWHVMVLFFRKRKVCYHWCTWHRGLWPCLPPYHVGTLCSLYGTCFCWKVHDIIHLCLLMYVFVYL